MTTEILEIKLTTEEFCSVSNLLDSVMNNEQFLNQNTFLETAVLFSHELPRRIREKFYTYKRYEREPILLIKGNPIAESDIGHTPSNYVELNDNFKLNRAQILHGLYGCLLGEPIGFSSQRKGSLYNNIIPLKEYEDVKNSSSGFKYEFGFHVEDAFHPARPDYLGLVCMRNEECAKTIVSCIDGIDLPEDMRDILFEYRYVNKHNVIHDTTGIINEEKQEIFFGNKLYPYLRINIATLNIEDYSEEEQVAIKKVVEHLNLNKVSVVLEPGDCVYIDNFRCVHARDPYNPDFGNNARWLSRLEFTNDLRKSQVFRKNKSSRVIEA